MENKENNNRADFLWGFSDGSVESLGYEFANASTEDYRKECWNALIEGVKQAALDQAIAARGDESYDYLRGYADGVREEMKRQNELHPEPKPVSLEKCVEAVITNRRDGVLGELDPNWRPSNFQYGNIEAEVQSVLSAAGVEYE